MRPLQQLFVAVTASWTSCSHRRTLASAGGRHWFDMARYADSSGLLGDSDLLPVSEIVDLKSQILPATGFHRNAVLNIEAGLDKEEACFQNLADRVNTAGRVWRGLTVSSAQCQT